MNICFENFAEEINAVISRSKKDNNTSIYTIQKAIQPHIQHFNGSVEENNITTIFGVNLSLISPEGHYIYGSTNRLHLPDFMSRLYQSLDNLLKANNGHKFCSDNVHDFIQTDKIVDLKYSDIATFDLAYLNSVLGEVYSSLSDDLKNDLNFCLRIKGNYSLWATGNSMGGQSEYDDLFVTITCEINLKNDLWHTAMLSELITPEQLRSKNFDTDAFALKIASYSENLRSKFSHVDDSKVSSTKELIKLGVKPDLIILDSTLAHHLLYKILTKGRNGNDESLLSIFGPKRKKLNIELKSHRKKSEDEALISPLYQNTFMVTPLGLDRHVHIEHKSSFEPTNGDIETLVSQAQKMFKVENVLYLSGISDTKLPDNASDIIVSPTFSLYFEKSKSSPIDLNLLCIESIKDLTLAGKKSFSVFELDPFNMPFCIHGNEAAILHVDSEKVRIL
jgi:hypothetical protein